MNGTHVTPPLPLVVASASPRRHRILRQLGLTFDVLATDAPEIHDAADPVGTVVTNATAKHDAGRRIRADAALLAADTLVWFDGRLLGKPADMQEAAVFLRAFSGKPQTVFTAVALSLPGLPPELRVAASVVHFRPLDEKLIQAYLNAAQPLDRAGAYDIAEHGEMIIADCRGSFTNVMGLPAEVVRDWFVARGLLPVESLQEPLTLDPYATGRPHFSC